MDGWDGITKALVSSSVTSVDGERRIGCGESSMTNRRMDTPSTGMRGYQDDKTVREVNTIFASKYYE
ncbi:unnamed protein product, partial [Phytomonas sp. Hart1]